MPTESNIFCLFSLFSQFTISIIQIEKSVDGVFGIRTWGRRMIGADETTELWRPLATLQQSDAEDQTNDLNNSNLLP